MDFTLCSFGQRLSYAAALVRFKSLDADRINKEKPAESFAALHRLRELQVLPSLLLLGLALGLLSRCCLFHGLADDHGLL